MIYRHWPPQYDPSIDPDLFYWFDASDTSTIKGAGGSAITDGATVYEWWNKGSKDTRLAQQGSHPRPVWRQSALNGMPAVMFNGSQVLGLTDITEFTSLAGLTLYIVCAQNVTPPGGVGSGGARAFHTSAGSLSATVLCQQFRANGEVLIGGKRLYGDTEVHAVLCGTYTLGEPIIVTGAFDYASARLDGYKNGVLCKRLDPFQTPGQTDSRALFSITVGAQVSAGGFFWGLTGPVSELLAVKQYGDPDEHVRRHHYLRTKWGIG